MLSKPTFAVTAAAALFANQTMAEAPALTEAETDLLTRLVDARCVPLSDPDRCDRVLLLRSETLDGMVDLVIHPVDERVPPVVARDVARHGDTFETAAYLETGPENTLLLHSQNTAQGRYPWFETLTIGLINDAFTVTAYHYSSYDRPMGGDFACDIDLMSGFWHVTGSRVEPESGNIIQTWDLDAQAHPDETELVWWSFREPPSHCDQVMQDWFSAAP